VSRGASIDGPIGASIREHGAASRVFDEAVAARQGINRTDVLDVDLIDGPVRTTTR